jgi:hypothetical protein
MGDFGHYAFGVGGVRFDVWGAGPYLIRAGRRRWFFEFSDRFGPVILRASDMEPADRQPIKESDPFWRPFQSWMKGGKKTRPIRNRKGLAIYSLCHYSREEQLQ